MRNLIVALICLLPTTTFASTELEHAYQTRWLEAVRVLTKIDLQNAGVDNSGRHAKISHALAFSVSFRQSEELRKPEGATRETALAECRTNTVHISPDANPSPTYEIVIHESLGALCIEDIDGQISTMLALAVEQATSNTPPLKNRPFKSHQTNLDFFRMALRQSLQGNSDYQESLIESLAGQAKIRKLNQYASDGSITRIGTAGDEIALAIKKALLTKIINSIRYDDEFGRFKIRQISNRVRIERVKIKNNSIHFVRTKKSGQNKWQEKYYFYVPRSTTVKSAVSQIYSCYMEYNPLCRRMDKPNTFEGDL